MRRFMNGTGRQDELTGLDEFTRCTVDRSGEMARMLLVYPVPAVQEDNRKRYWDTGNPVYWRQRGHLIIHPGKLPDSEHPLHPEYGLKQRFPSVESQLASAPLGQLIEHILADDFRDVDTSAWSRLAWRAIVRRPDRLSAVIPLLRSMNRAKHEDGRLAAINAVDRILLNCRDRDLLEAVRDPLAAIAAEEKDWRTRDRAVILLRRVETLLQHDLNREPGQDAAEPPPLVP
jgi:hypothetical protein